MNYLLPAVLILVLGVGFTIMALRIRSRRGLEARVHELAQLAEAGRVLLNTPLDVQRLAEKVYEEAGRIVDTRLFQLGLFEGNEYSVIFWNSGRRTAASFPLHPRTWSRGHRGLAAQYAATAVGG